jgi:NOL1/NOP2/fmu family ribosome biogenesis protein
MGLGDSFKRKINLSVDDERLSKYLHGEEISVDCSNGWAVVMVEGCALGGAKVVNGVAKNHYPKGLRSKV